MRRQNGFAAVAFAGVIGFQSGCAWLESMSATPPNTTPNSPGVRVAQPMPAGEVAGKVEPSATLPESESKSETTPSEDAPAGLTRVSFAEEGADFDPCPTPDGTRVVFSSTRHRSTSDIYVKRVDSRVVTQLTTDPGDDAMPAVSPDGTRIAFASNRAGNWDIYVMPISGGQSVQITSEPGDEVCPSWSPDGQSLAFSRLGEASGRWEIWTVSVENPSTPTFVGYGLYPRWNPKAGSGASGGDVLAYQLTRERGRRSFGIWTLELMGGAAVNHTEIASSATSAFINPSWSGDGRRLFFAEVPAPEGSMGAKTPRAAWGTLWMYDMNGEGRVRLGGGRGVHASPAWATGDRLFFVSDRSGSDCIWAMDLSQAIKAAEASTGGTVRTTVHNSQSSPSASADNVDRLTNAGEEAAPR
jgi:TolB protein